MHFSEVPSAISDVLHIFHARRPPIPGYDKTTCFSAKARAIESIVASCLILSACILWPFFAFPDCLLSVKGVLLSILGVIGSIVVGYLSVQQVIYLYRLIPFKIITAPDGLHIYGYDIYYREQTVNDSILKSLFAPEKGKEIQYQWVDLEWNQIRRIGRSIHKGYRGRIGKLLVRLALDIDIVVPLDCFSLRVTAEVAKYKLCRDYISVDDFRKDSYRNFPTNKKKQKHRRR